MKDVSIKNKDLEKKSNLLLIIGIVLLTIFLSVGITLWVINHYIFPKKFNPVVLSQKEDVTLNTKIEQFSWLNQTSSTSSNSEINKLEPEKYSEKNAIREINLSERELNALLAKNTDLANKLAIDLSENLASGKLLVPMDRDFPVLGGKTLKISAGIELSFSNDRPIIKLKGVSLMGIPIPNAWLGGIKNVDLINEFGQDEGFWKAFADGVENIHVNDGNLVIKLKE
ncbi:MAG: hypothetical protein KAH20_02735 [Methylococcales bacterium]|nr:hypothetical protein [Methylococcales bacterium]